ncbi:LrgB family protein [Limosilactobacillus caccae]|uniref:LrgB family protein n=1 Tax=Limosilactobacillus caccae TaxID=1926284 RepID=UPI0009703916|nr:LrgB family protein [Limosilactobacillus caccae]
MTALTNNLALPFTGIFMTLVVFLTGQWLFKKTNGFFLFQPLFFGMVVGIIILIIWGKVQGRPTAYIYQHFYKPGADIVFWFVNPATIAFAIPLYKRNDVLKKYWFDIILALVVSSVICLFITLGTAKLVGLSHSSAAGLLPEAATTAIAMPVAEAIGGNSAITAMACIVKAVILYVLADILIKTFRLQRSKIGLGLGLGTGGTIGSAKALEYGMLEGAMASVCVVIIGIVVDLVVIPFAHLFM